ncbi:MAG: hypothetical protein ACE5D7_09145 [Fidelibacterota bacterium]
MTNKITWIVFIFTSFVGLSVFANPGGQGEHHGHHSDSSMGKKHGKSHHFTAHWAETLPDKQKLLIDRMHLEVARKLGVLKAKAELLQKELNTLTAQDGAEKQLIYSHIDKLTTVKNEILHVRYDHILEMREILSETQRISYDMAVLNRNGAK